MNLVRANSPVLQFEAGAGNTMANGWLKTFLSGTTTPVQTYRNKAGDLNPSEIQLNYRGEADVWLDDEKEYRFELWDVTKTRLIWRRDNVTAAGTSSYGAKDIVYIDIESIDNPPPNLYTTVQTAIGAGKIPVIRYNGALYYFDKQYTDNDEPAYSFVGKLDSDEWHNVIRVTSEAVTLGNVLGMNGSVAGDARNSYPLGGKCGIANNDEDYPYLIFDNQTLAYNVKFNDSYGYGYVAGANERVDVEYDGHFRTIREDHSVLVFVTIPNVVSESHNDSGISLPAGFVLVDKPYGHTIACGRAPIESLDSTMGVSLIVLENTFGLEAGTLLDTSYSVHGGFWRKASSSQGCQHALSVGAASIASGSSMSAAFNGGKAAGPLSLANGLDALAAAAYSASLGQMSIAAFGSAIAFAKFSAALHEAAMVLAAYGISGRPHQTVLGRSNVMDPDAAVVIGWGNEYNGDVRKNITRIDTDGYIFSGKRLDLANNIMPLFKLPDSDPDSPGIEPVTGYWICDSKKQLVTASEIVALHNMGMKFVLCENVDPDSNSRMYVEQKSIITSSNIDIEFVSVDNATITKIVVQKITTAEVTTASLYIASSTVKYVADLDQMKEMEEMFFINLPCDVNALRFEFSDMDYNPTVASVGSSGTWKKLSAKFHNVWDWKPNYSDFSYAFQNAFIDSSNLVSLIAAGDTSGVTDARNMFTGCTALTSVALFDTTSVEDMSSMFEGCTSLTSVPLFNTSSVTNMDYMLYECTKVEGGALALYQQASTQTTPPSDHTLTFNDCGSETTTGAAELAQIPASWGGTAS